MNWGFSGIIFTLILVLIFCMLSCSNINYITKMKLRKSKLDKMLISYDSLNLSFMIMI